MMFIHKMKDAQNLIDVKLIISNLHSVRRAMQDQMLVQVVLVDVRLKIQSQESAQHAVNAQTNLYRSRKGDWDVAHGLMDMHLKMHKGVIMKIDVMDVAHIQIDVHPKIYSPAIMKTDMHIAHVRIDVRLKTCRDLISTKDVMDVAHVQIDVNPRIQNV